MSFGVDVYAPHPELPVMCRALDVAASQVQAEAADSSGTHYWSVYRLCLAEPKRMVVVVLQDGGVRFVRTWDGRVVFWEQLTV